MPTPKDGESEKDFVSRCIPIVMKDGTAKDNKQASAICYSMYRNKNKKSTADKVGARHSQSDMSAIQVIHDNACDLGAECKPMDMNEGITAMLDRKSFVKSIKMHGMSGMEYAIHEGWDIQQCCSVISQVIDMCQDECAEGEMDEAKFLCDVAMSLIDYCKGECQEMMDSMNDGGISMAMMSRVPARVRDANDGDTNTLNLSYVKSLGIELPINKLAVKYVGKNTIAHPVFLWGDAKKTDLEIEFFNQQSDFWDKQLEGFERPLTWEHGQDEKFAKFEPNPVIGKTVKFYDDDIARWAESVINTDKQYRKFIDQFIEEKRLGYSSDSAPQYVIRSRFSNGEWYDLKSDGAWVSPSGKVSKSISGATLLKMWPWFGGALTASPCEPRMKVFTPEFLKSLGIAIPDIPKQEWQAGKAKLDYLRTKYT